MNRLERFEKFRFVGYKHNMKLYDCDNLEQYKKISSLLSEIKYIELNLIQSFSPDTLDEAKNRGFSSL